MLVLMKCLATSGSGDSDDIEGTPGRVDPCRHYTRVLQQPADKVLCAADPRAGHQDTLEGSSKKPM